VIDLGMAAEILLMHDPASKGDGKGEITNKMATRGALLVGQDVAARTILMKTFSDLYGARSTTVHTGNASAKFHNQIPEFDRAVQNVVEALLVRGSFPNWKHLTLGGQ